jgi:peptide/nickel transport system ATP-binding protein
VTALSILRLVPSPPGRLEGGRVFLEEPDDVHRLREEYDAIARPRLEKQGIHGNVTSAQVRSALTEEIKTLDRQLAQSSSMEDKRQMRLRLQAARSDFDILEKPIEELREIRGDKISMIFQEPMTALNPVFTVGDQIAETLILHRRADLCRDVLKSLELQIAMRARKRKGRRLNPARAKDALLRGRSPANLPDSDRASYERMIAMREDERVCSSCYAPAPRLWDYCSSCGVRLTFDLWSPFRGRIMRIERRLYERMLSDPRDQLVDFVNSVRVLRRLVRGRLRDEGLRWAIEALRDVQMPEPERIAGQYPFELSGGMRQRSMIAMMMACRPKLLIADEPTTALDVTVEAQILKLMKELQQRTNMAILLITHDLGIVAEVCDQVGVMYAGSIVEFGTSQALFHRMKHPYTHGLMQAIPRFRATAAEARKRELYIIRGTVPNLLHPPSGCRFHPRCPRALDVCAEVVPKLAEMEPGHFAACHNPVPYPEESP